MCKKIIGVERKLADLRMLGSLSFVTRLEGMEILRTAIKSKNCTLLPGWIMVEFRCHPQLTCLCSQQTDVEIQYGGL